MNVFNGIGRLVRDVEVRTNSNGTEVGKFTIAINRITDKDKADFINIVCFGKTALNVQKFTSKGSLVGVTGSIKTGSFEKDGVKQYTMDVIGDSVQFLESKGARSESNNNVSPYDYQNQDLHNNKQDYAQNDIFSEFGDAVRIDDNFLD